MIVRPGVIPSHAAPISLKGIRSSLRPFRPRCASGKLTTRNASLAWTAAWRAASDSDERDQPEFEISSQRFSVARLLALEHQPRLDSATTRGTDEKSGGDARCGSFRLFPALHLQ